MIHYIFTIHSPPSTIPHDGHIIMQTNEQIIIIFNIVKVNIYLVLSFISSQWILFHWETRDSNQNQLCSYIGYMLSLIRGWGEITPNLISFSLNATIIMGHFYTSTFAFTFSFPPDRSVTHKLLLEFRIWFLLLLCRQFRIDNEPSQQEQKKNTHK